MHFGVFSRQIWERKMTSYWWRHNNEMTLLCTWAIVVNIVTLIFYHNNAVFMLLLWPALWGPPFWFGTLWVQCTLRVHACLLYCLSLTWMVPFWFIPPSFSLSLTWMAPFCYGLYCGGRHFDFIRTLRVQCTLRVQAWWNCTVYRSHGWRHFDLVNTPHHP